MLVYIILYVILSLAAGHIGEILWTNVRHEQVGRLFETKAAACKVLYAILGLGAIASQGPIAAFAVLAGLPVCLAHLSLIGRNPLVRLTGMAIARHLWERTRATFERFVNRGRLDPRP